MTADDVDAVAELTARVFGRGGDEAGMRARVALAYRHSPALRPDHGLVAERAGRIVAKWQALDLQVRIGGTGVRAAGLHAVVTDPEIDGEGLVWTMVPAGLARLAELGHDLAIGFAQKGGAYAALGGAPLAADYLWSADAWRLPQGGTPRFRAVSAGDVPRLVALSEAAQAGRSGSLVRSVELAPWLDRAAPTLWLEEEGYLGVRDAPDAVEVREAAGTTAAFYRRALSRLRAHAETKRVREVRGHLPPDHPLVEASVPYGARVAIEHPRRSGMMGAVLDASSLLPRLQDELATRLARARGRHAAVELDVRCEGAPSVRLAVGAPASPTTRLALEVRRGQLAQLVFGYRSARWLEGATVRAVSPEGELLAPDAALALADDLFPQGTPFLQHTDRW